MNKQEQHKMILEEQNAFGEENWYCPTCGRRMTITWHPWKRIILEPGDMYAAHSVSKGGLQIGSLQIVQANDAATSAAEVSVEDPYLAPWQRWLNQVDSDDLWNKEV